MDYLEYGPENFAADPFFCAWVLHPDVASDDFWMDWTRYNPHKAEVVETARRMVLLAASDPDEDPSEQAVERIWKGIEARKTQEAKVFSLRSVRWSRIRMAASVTGILLLAFSLWRYRGGDGQEYITAYGESRRVQLPDGTQVVLNANSRLRLTGGWNGDGDRNVQLEGEAFFRVSKMERKAQPVKFTVHTDDMHIDVKGTQFNVNTRQERTYVVLSEGKVQLRLHSAQKERTIEMKPGDWVGFSKEQQRLTTGHEPDPEQLFSWKDNRWIFHDTPLAEVAVLIKDTYGLPVYFENDSIASLKISGSIRSDSLQDLMNAMESILRVAVTVNHDKIMISEVN